MNLAWEHWCFCGDGQRVYTEGQVGMSSPGTGGPPREGLLTRWGDGGSCGGHRQWLPFGSKQVREEAQGGGLFRGGYGFPPGELGCCVKNT